MSTNAIRIAVAPSASPRKSRSTRASAPRSDAARLAVVMETPKCRSGTEAESLFQIVPLRARRFNRPTRVAGPIDHRACIEPRFLPVQQLVQHEPVGRRPMPRVAVAHGGPRGHNIGDGCEFGLRLQPIGFRVVELRAVYIQCPRNVTVCFRSWRLLLAGVKGCRPRVDERGAALALDRLNVARQGQDAVIDACSENFRRRWLRSAFERQTCLPPSGNAAIENRDILQTDVFQSPIGARR